jgi:hypothetical protein
MGWIVAAVLAVVLALGGVEYDRQRAEARRVEALAARYAEVIAACANDGHFKIGERHLVVCKTKTVPAVY